MPRRQYHIALPLLLLISTPCDVSSQLSVGSTCYRSCVNSASTCTTVALQNACGDATCVFENASSSEAFCMASGTWIGCTPLVSDVLSSGSCASGVASPVGTVCTKFCTSGATQGAMTCTMVGGVASFQYDCATLPTAATTTTPAPSDSDKITDKAWFWVLVILLPLLLLSIIAAFAFLHWRRSQRGNGGKTQRVYGAKGVSPRNPICFKSPPRNGPSNFGVLQDGNKKPLVSALKGSPRRQKQKQKQPLAPPSKKGVTFSEYHPGDAVEAWYEGVWFTAVVQTHNADGTYIVLWSGGKAVSTIPASYIRGRAPRGGTKASYADSDDYSNDYAEDAPRQIQCLWQNEWHTGSLEAVNPDGTYVIRYVIKKFLKKKCCSYDAI